MSSDTTSGADPRRTDEPNLVERLVGATKRTVGDALNSVDADSFYTVGDDIADTKAPQVPIDQRWDERRFNAKLVNPANRRKLSVIIVGTGLAGGAAAATLGEATR
jgi:succinate dehydrogenase / fumarate reductase flavoprotein subunit